MWPRVLWVLISDPPPLWSLQGSELAYIYACLFLGFVPLVCAAAGYGVVKLQNRRRRRLKMRQEQLKTSTTGKPNVDKMSVCEWLHANHKRLVKVRQRAATRNG